MKNLKANKKAVIGTIIGTIMEGMILENFSAIPKEWYFQVPILCVFGFGLTIFVHVGRWVQIAWTEEDVNRID